MLLQARSGGNVRVKNTKTEEEGNVIKISENQQVPEPEP
jgi:hypothetical protein